MEPPFFDPYPKDYAEEVIMKGISLITTNAQKIQEVLEYNMAAKKLLSDKVGVRNLLIEQHYYDLTYGFGRCPRIRLNAKWLDKWGFKKGHRVNIITLPDLLILTPQNVNKTVPLITRQPPKRYTL